MDLYSTSSLKQQSTQNHHPYSELTSLCFYSLNLCVWWRSRKYPFLNRCFFKRLFGIQSYTRKGYFVIIYMRTSYNYTKNNSWRMRYTFFAVFGIRGGGYHVIEYLCYRLSWRHSRLWLWLRCKWLKVFDLNICLSTLFLEPIISWPSKLK